MKMDRTIGFLIDSALIALTVLILTYIYKGV